MSRPAWGAKRGMSRALIMAVIICGGSMALVALATLAVSGQAAATAVALGHNPTLGNGSPGNGPITVQGGGGTITYVGSGGGPGSSTPGQGAGAARPAVFYGYIPSLSSAPGVGACVTTTAVPYPTQAAATTVTESYWKQWYVLSVLYPTCPGASSSLGATPGQVAQTWWQTHGQDLLPAPSPRIAPGYALAGKLSYLQTGASLSQNFDNPTPLGELMVKAQGEVYVDWGERVGWQGPFSSPGRPWPFGTITHAWDWTGHYKIQVQIRWGAVWSLGNASGRLTELHTEGVIPDFQVRQLEGIRNR